MDIQYNSTFLDGGCVDDENSRSSCAVVFQDESDHPPESVLKVKERRQWSAKGSGETLG